MYVNWKEPFFGASVSVNSKGRVTSCAHREPYDNKVFCLGKECRDLFSLHFGKNTLPFTFNEYKFDCFLFFREML